MIGEPEALAALVKDIIWTADPQNRHCGMTLEQDEVELLAQHFSTLAALSPALDRGEVQD